MTDYPTREYIIRETTYPDATKQELVGVLVRCEDCKWWHDWNGECYAKEAQGFGHLWNADDYCSYGERKEGDA